MLISVPVTVARGANPLTWLVRVRGQLLTEGQHHPNHKGRGERVLEQKRGKDTQVHAGQTLSCPAWPPHPSLLPA